MRLFILPLLLFLFTQTYAQDTIRINYKPVVAVNTTDGGVVKALKADEVNGLVIMCPAMNEDVHLEGLRYEFRVKDDLARIVRDKDYSYVFWIYPNSALMKKKKVTSIQIEVWLVFPSHPVYIAGQWHKDKPLYDKDGMVIPGNALWARIEPAKNQPGEYLLATETFAVEMK